MKFSYKIILSTLTMIAIVFTLGSVYMITSNHEHLLAITKERAINAHEIEAFSLESKLMQDSTQTSQGSDEKSIRNRAIHYMKQFSAYSPSQTRYALYDDTNTPLYSTIDAKVTPHTAQADKASYYMDTLHNHPTMIIVTPLSAGDFKGYFYSCQDFMSLYEERDRQYRSFLVVASVIILLSFGFIYVITQYLTKPIKRLNEASTRIAAGHYSERTSIPTKDEIGELSRNFDHMAEANEHKIQELSNSVKQREEFIASFSHEIKTPMTAILGFAEMLRTYECDEETRRKAADYIYVEGKRLEKLSYTLMQLLSLGEKITLHSVATRALVTQLKRYYDGNGQAEIVQFQVVPACVQSHSELLFTLMRNLIDNAIKASKQDQCVQVIGEKQDHLYTFTVEDHGIGMTQEELKQILQPFYMADKSRARSKGGAGLGLAIAKRICDLHHTALTFTSSPNIGTRVSFTLEEVFHE